jgi:hypothetical protein
MEACYLGCFLDAPPAFLAQLAELEGKLTRGGAPRTFGRRLVENKGRSVPMEQSTTQ